MTLDDLRREYEADVIGPQLWTLTCDLARPVARRYPPAVYNSGENWTDGSIEELAQDVVAERLLGEHQLEYLFDTAQDLEAFRRLLVLQVRRTLAHRKSLTVVDRLLSRVRGLTSEAPFLIRTIGRDRWICLDGHEVPHRSIPDSELRSAAEAIHHIPRLLEVDRAERASMVYTTPNLKKLLEIEARKLGGFTESDLAKIFEILLTSWLPTFLVELEEHQLPATGAVDDNLEYQEMARHVRTFEDDLDEIDRIVLLCKSQDISDNDVADHVDRSRPWVADRKKAVFARVGEEVMSGLPPDLHAPALKLLLDEISSRLVEGEE